MKNLLVALLLVLIGAVASAQELKQQKATTKGAVRLFADKDDLTSIIMLIPAGSTVEVIRQDSTYAIVDFEGEQGYVQKSQIEMQAPVISPAPIYPPGYQQAEQTYDRYGALVRKYGEDIGKRLDQHKVWKGITSEMVRDSWGKPVQIDRTFIDQSVEEKWIYSTKYLFFRDGILIDWGPVKQ